MLEVHTTYGAAEDIIITDRERMVGYMPYLDIGLSLAEAKKLANDLQVVIQATEQANAQFAEWEKMRQEAIERGECNEAP